MLTESSQSLENSAEKRQELMKYKSLSGEAHVPGVNQHQSFSLLKTNCIQESVFQLAERSSWKTLGHMSIISQAL